MRSLVTFSWLTVLAASDVIAGPPRPSPPIYASPNHFVTFSTPPRSFYCPLPDDWVGSDHGTILFLKRPSNCGGGGYPSSSRAFEPASTPRLEVYYGYVVDEAPPQRCWRAGSVRMLGALEPLCRGRRGRLIEVTVSSEYRADEESEFYLTLVTTKRRLRKDLQSLKVVAETVRGCGAVRTDPCPAGASWF